MSASSSAQSELPSSASLTALGTVTSIRTSNQNLYSPINGVVGHTFIRLCLWFDLLSSWKKRSYSPPVDGFLNFAASETEVVPDAATS